MADAKICDCCGELIKDLYQARMHVFYYEENNGFGGSLFGVRKKTPTIEVDLCGECWDKIRGSVGGKKDDK